VKITGLKSRLPMIELRIRTPLGSLASSDTLMPPPSTPLRPLGSAVLSPS